MNTNTNPMLVVAIPTREKVAVLHVVGCRKVHSRARTTGLKPHLRLLELGWDEVQSQTLIGGSRRVLGRCECVSASDIDAEVRRLHAQEKREAEEKVLRDKERQAQWERERLAGEKFVEQFSGLHAVVEETWGARVRLGKSYTSDLLDNSIELELTSRDPRWKDHPVLSVHARIDEEDRTALSITLISHSTGLVRSVRDSRRLADALEIVAAWRSEVDLVDWVAQFNRDEYGFGSGA